MANALFQLLKMGHESRKLGPKEISAEMVVSCALLGVEQKSGINRNIDGLELNESNYFLAARTAFSRHRGADSGIAMFIRLRHEHKNRPPTYAMFESGLRSIVVSPLQSAKK